MTTGDVDERKEKEGKGKEEKGREGKGKERKGKERKGKERRLLILARNCLPRRAAADAGGRACTALQWAAAEGLRSLLAHHVT